VAKKIAMSTLALSEAKHGARSASRVANPQVRLRTYIVAFALGFPLVFYLLLLAAVIIQYGHLPNYLTPYNWISNVLRIVAGTRSVADMVPIILDEWLIETGYMNFDYGHGIADWSLSIIPHKLAILSLAGALIGLNFGLLLGRQTAGTGRQQVVQACWFGLFTSAGALCTSVTNATVFSVVHCATPSWVGSLAVLGFDSYDVFAIEPFGSLICLFGLAMLAASALLIARDSRAAADAELLPRPVKGAAPC
jgi:hypothetical protein